MGTKENGLSSTQPRTIRETYDSPPRRKKRRRKRLTSAGRVTVAVLAVFLLAAAVMGGLWVFLRVGKVSVEGKSRYSAAQICAASGIQTGSRLFGVDKSAVSTKLRSALPYIQNVTLSWRLPDTLVLRVRSDTAFAAIARASGGYAVVDKEGKVLETPADLQGFSGLSTVTGPDASKLSTGQSLSAAGKASLSTAVSIMKTFRAAGVKQITGVDVHNRYQITFTYQNRITVLIGTSEALDVKGRYAADMLNKELGSADKGTLDVSRSGENSQAIFTPSD